LPFACHAVPRGELKRALAPVAESAKEHVVAAPLAPPDIVVTASVAKSSARMRQPYHVGDPPPAWSVSEK
jgi:hypothetical protein